MKIAADFSIIFAIVAIISASEDSGTGSFEVNESEESLRECLEEEVTGFLVDTITCIRRQEEQEKRITAECCIKHFNSSTPESFKKNMKNCSEERDEEMLGICVWRKGVDCKMPNGVEERFESYSLYKKPEKEEGCKEEYWNNEMDHFKAECARKRPDMEKPCEAALNWKPANAAECTRQKLTCVSNQWKSISALCCEEYFGKENFTRNVGICKVHKLMTMDCDQSECNGLPFEERETAKYEHLWVGYDTAVELKDKEECETRFVEEEVKVVKSICDNETDEKKKHLCESLFACRSEE